ncbi:DedA family protein [Ramlibacter algicola]|uniref:DedA family protein n=1 Tax=Ramlibacter algicola TaxID=2795217 RepID=A0A934USE8_9BURK|nr:DedA family protein [Ramlibacter algicola]MBK0393668.1 DedA family protein [Ramlibacter algicola]
MGEVLAFLQSLQGAPAYALVFAALAASGFGLPVNEDLLVVVAAALTLRGVMDPVLLAVVAWLGVMTADLLVVHWGRLLGTRVLEHPRLARLLPPRRLAQLQGRMQRWGPGYLAAVRFLPGLRSPMLFAAGSLRVPSRQVLLFDGGAGAIELPLLIAVVRTIGTNWEDILAALQRHPGLAVACALAAVAIAASAWWWLRRRKRAMQ